MARLATNIRPSLKSGFARSASESAFPELWKDLILAHVPELGLTGGVLPDYSGFSDLQYSGTADGANSKLYRGSYCHLWDTDGEGVVINSQPAEDRSGITCMVFYSPIDLTTANGKHLFNKRGSGGSPRYWQMYHASAAENFTVQIRYSSDTATKTVNAGDNTVSGGDWQQAAFSVTDNQANDDIVLYLNGAITNTSTMGAGNVRDVGAEQIMIGQTWAGGSNAQSYIKSCFQWNRVLDDAEVKLLNQDPLVLFRKRSSFILSSAQPAAGGHIYFSMQDSGRFGVGRSQLAVRES